MIPPISDFGMSSASRLTWKMEFMMNRILMSVILVLLAAPAVAQTSYPNKPIRFVVPYAPGGFTDILARVIGQKLTESWGQPVLVENKGGGGSTIGSDIVAKAPADGYTILMVAPDLAINPGLYPKLPYDTSKDFAPVSLVAWGPMVLVAHPSLPVHSVKELITLIKSEPRPLNYASGGNGSGGHLAMELLKSTSGVSITHVPYRGIGPASNDLLGGQVSLMFLQLAVARPYIMAGKLRALAITGRQRSEAMPELPTMGEAGFPGFEVSTWFGIVTRAETPKDIVAKLNAEIAKIMRLPDIKARISMLGGEPVTNTSEEFATFIKSEVLKWADVIRVSGAHVD